jgi:hypothetical protein
LLSRRKSNCAGSRVVIVKQCDFIGAALLFNLPCNISTKEKPRNDTGVTARTGWVRVWVKRVCVRLPIATRLAPGRLSAL